MTPRQIIQFLQGGQDPRQLTLQLLQQRMGNSPMGQSLIALAEQDKVDDIEQFARNLAAQQGIDYDTEFASFKKMLGF